jgi:hypothetical protein
LLLTASPDAAAAAGGGEAAARLLAQVTGERALLQERPLDRRKAAQDRRKAAQGGAWRDVRFARALQGFAVVGEVLLDTEHTPLPSRSLLSPRWMGLSKVLASPAPLANTHRLDLPSSWRMFNEFNVDRLRPYVRRGERRRDQGPGRQAPNTLRA